MAGFQSLGSTDGNRQKQCLVRFLVKYIKVSSYVLCSLLVMRDC